MSNMQDTYVINFPGENLFNTKQWTAIYDTYMVDVSNFTISSFVAPSKINHRTEAHNVAKFTE